MTSVPTPLLVTQWVLLFALSALVVVMYRQLAHLLRLSDSANDAGGLAPGAAVPTFTYRRPGRPGVDRFVPGSGSAVLLFTDPRCGACDTVLDGLERVVSAGARDQLRVLVMTDADDTAVAANDALGRTSLEVALVDHRVVSHEFRVNATPLEASTPRSLWPRRPPGEDA
jgi:hypothetical protein